MHRSVYAAKFEVSPGRVGWVVVRNESGDLERIDTASDWLLEASLTDSPNSVKVWAESVALWWRWCTDSGVDPLSAAPWDLSRYVVALQSVPKHLPLTSQVRALPGDHRLRAASTIRQRVEHLKKFYRWASVRGLVATGVGKQVASFRSPRATQMMTAPRLTPHQVKDLLSREFSARNRLVIELLYGAGLRQGEALGLHVEDVCVNMEVARLFNCQQRFEGPHLHVRRRLNPNGAIAKSRVERIAPMAPRVMMAFSNWQAWLFDHLPQAADSRFVLLSVAGRTRGRAWSVAGFWSMWKARVQTIPGLEDSYPHLLRHTFASELQDAGVDPFLIQELLGHRHPSSTAIYTHAHATTMVAAVESLSRWRESRIGV